MQFIWLMMKFQNLNVLFYDKKYVIVVMYLLTIDYFI